MIERMAEANVRRSRQGGFTLIELLVVIVILGLLSAVVVFAVRGTGDKGRVAAFSTDLKTLRTAEEAYCAKFGTYGTEQQLVDERFLSEESTVHDVELGTGGPCNGSSFNVVSTPGNEWSGAALPDDQQLLTVAYRGDPWTTSKLRFSRFPLDANTYETLVKVQNDYTMGPRLATGWDLINPGNNPAYPGNPTWRFHLRPGVTFHDGSALGADDVKYSMDRLVTLADDFSAKLGASSSVVVDPLTVDITPAEANFRLPETVVHPTYGILASGTEPSTNPPTTATVVGTGPFKFKSYSQTNNLVVERYDGYWGARSKLKELTLRFIADATARRLALEGGQIDVMYDVGRQQVAGLRANSSLQVLTAPTSYVFNIYMNLNGTDAAHNELNTEPVRRALALSINRPEFVDQNWEAGVATDIQTPSPPSILGSYASMVSGYTFDQVQARDLLDDDGWTCGGGAPGADTPCAAGEFRQKAGEPLNLFMLSQTGNADDPLLQDLKARVAQVGIDMTIGSTLTSAQRSSRKNQGLWDLDHTNPNQNDANPAFLLALQWWSKSINPWVSCLAATPPNCGPWQQAGPAFDSLVEQALGSLTFDGTQNFAAQAMDYLVDQQAMIVPLAGLSRVYGLKNGVQGFSPPHPAESHLSWAGVYRTA